MTLSNQRAEAHHPDYPAFFDPEEPFGPCEGLKAAQEQYFREPGWSEQSIWG